MEVNFAPVAVGETITIAVVVADDPGAGYSTFAVGITVRAASRAVRSEGLRRRHR